MSNNFDAKTEYRISPWLPRVLRLVAVAFIVFFGGVLLSILIGLDHYLLASSEGRLMVRLLRWGSQEGGGEHYELMIASVYVVWGFFLWKAAANPLNHKLFLDFTLAANTAHFGLMFLQSILMHGEHIHMAGDVLLGVVLLGLLAAVWLPARKYAAPY